MRFAQRRRAARWRSSMRSCAVPIRRPWPRGSQSPRPTFVRSSNGCENVWSRPSAGSLPTRKPVKTFPESEPRSALDLAGFRLDDDAWLAQARDAQGGPCLDRWLKYEILSPAMRGGQAMVYRCRRGDGVIVAVKRVHGG